MAGDSVNQCQTTIYYCTLKPNIVATFRFWGYGDGTLGLVWRIVDNSIRYPVLSCRWGAVHQWPPSYPATPMSKFNPKDWTRGGTTEKCDLRELLNVSVVRSVVVTGKSKYGSTVVKGCRRNKAIINVDVLVEAGETSRKHC